MQTQPELIILVGLPGCGKSTWRQEFFADGSRNPADWVIISRDDAVDDYIAKNPKADGTHLRYDEVMADPNLRDRLAADQEAKLAEAVTYGDNVIVDRTNLTPKDRAAVMLHSKTSGHNYRAQAVVFDVPFETILERAKHRGMGKHIPDEVLQDMSRRLTPVGNDEGFALVTTIRQGCSPDGPSARARAAGLATTAGSLAEPKKP